MKVVCINIDSIRGGSSAYGKLTLWRVYEVKECEEDVEVVDYGDGSEYYKILKDDNGVIRRLYKERFITLREYRRRKLEKIRR